MRCLIAVFALVVGAFAAPQPRSRVPTLDGRIVGGVAVDIEDYPYQVSLQYFGSHICGGSIISQKYIVTAAHCTAGATPSVLSIRAGSAFHDSGGKKITVSEIYQNPLFDQFNIDYDISVVKVRNPLRYGVAISPINLPDEDYEVPPGTIAYCTGWGALAENGFLPSELQCVEVPIVSRASCRNAYSDNQISDRMICAGVSEGGKDACQGDSGGPLVAEGKLVGIVSWGYGCARPKYPGVYSNVAALRTFIASVTQ